MWQYALKVALTSVIVVAVAELAKRSSVWAALLASLPLTSLLAFVWLYLDTQDTYRVATLANNILWLVLPSLLLLAMLPLLLRGGWGFWPALAASCSATVAAYLLTLWLLPRLGTSA